MTDNPEIRASTPYRRVVELARACYSNRPLAGALSTGERCAVGLLLNDPTCLPIGYTFIDAVDRLEGDWLAACVQANRDGWRFNG